MRRWNYAAVRTKQNKSSPRLHWSADNVLAELPRSRSAPNGPRPSYWPEARDRVMSGQWMSAVRRPAAPVGAAAAVGAALRWCATAIAAASIVAARARAAAASRVVVPIGDTALGSTPG